MAPVEWVNGESGKKRECISIAIEIAFGEPVARYDLHEKKSNGFLTVHGLTEAVPRLIASFPVASYCSNYYSYYHHYYCYFFY